MMKLQKRDVIYIVITVSMIIVIVCTSVIGVIKKRALLRNLEYSKAVILKFSSGPRGRRYLDYAFEVNETKYLGSGKYYPKYDTLSIGDTIMIVYDKMNPDNNKSERDL